MIKSILDTDLYKFSVSYAYFNIYPLAEGTFTFTDRRKEKWTDKEQRDMLRDMFNDEMVKLSRLKCAAGEIYWCVDNIPYIPQTYWEWLGSFRFNYGKINTWFDDDCVFHCSVTDKLYKTTLYEIAILATYSEVRNKVLGIEAKPKTVRDIIRKKLDFANENGIMFSEFGTRRRFSSDVQDTVLKEIVMRSQTCVGTSNVYYAKQYNLKPIGTFPHEWVMFHGACFGYKRANYISLEDWIATYRGDLGIALVDTYTTKSFLHTLTKQQALLLSGFRQDSGDEIAVGEAIIDRLKELGIDPTTKTIVFSNALDFEKALRVQEHFKGRCKVSFGIGTNLTCDIGVEDYKPANIVMKLTMCRLSDKDWFEDCIKISDDIGKQMGSSIEFGIANEELGLCIDRYTLKLMYEDCKDFVV